MRKGASVSIMIRSSGAFFATSWIESDFAYVSIPVKLILVSDQKAKIASAKSQSSLKQWTTNFLRPDFLSSARVTGEQFLV